MRTYFECDIPRIDLACWTVLQDPPYLHNETTIDVPAQKLDYEWQNPRQQPAKLEFDNAEAAFASHSTLSIVRSLTVYTVRACHLLPLPTCVQLCILPI